MAGEYRYFENSHHAMKNHAINSVRAVKAAEITSRLNLRIRFSCAWVQLVSPPLTEIRLGTPTDP
jgi:hypothetical protein